MVTVMGSSKVVQQSRSTLTVYSVVEASPSPMSLAGVNVRVAP